VRFGQVRAVGDGEVQVHLSVGTKRILLAELLGEVYHLKEVERRPRSECRAGRSITSTRCGSGNVGACSDLVHVLGGTMLHEACEGTSWRAPIGTDEYQWMDPWSRLPPERQLGGRKQ
jgi:hypothetical protein